MTLYFLNYNNYYNRIVKREDTLSDYLDYLVGEPVQGVINWNPRDGVNTEQILNSWTYDTPDYLIVTDDSNNIVSRWFVIEAEYLRNSQYRVQLHRDVVVDYYNSIINSPCFIEKATVQSDNPLIYNSENMDFNQIKSGEVPIKDKSGCAWLVGYFARTDGTATTELSGTINASYNVDYVVNGPLSQFEYYDYLNKDLYMNPSYIRYYLYTTVKNSSGATPTDTADFYLEGITGEVRGGREGYWMEEVDTNLFFTPSSYPGDTQVKNFLVQHKQEFNDAAAKTANFSTSQQTTEIMNLNGKVIQYNDNGQIKFSRMVLVDQGKYTTAGFTVKSISQGATYTEIRDLLNQIGVNTSASDWGDEGFQVSYRANKYRIELQDVEEIDKYGFEYKISSNRIHPSDCPFDMFAVPYGDNVTIVNVDDYDGSKVTLKPSKSLMINLVTELAAQQGSKVYDVQLLPYCPMQSLINSDGEIDLATLNRREANGPIGYANFYRKTEGTATTAVGVILLPTLSSFTLNINVEDIVTSSDDIPIAVTEPKVQALCDMYRLCSPNYNGQFEFNIAKNQGLSWFNVDCTYLPYNPYIHINPNFQNLYGSDYNDARGLICKGDFSISLVSDQWAQYQLNNKNYQNSFDRQIQNMEFNNRFAGISDVVGAVTGTIGGATSGAIAGGMQGAIGGGVASALGGAADIWINQSLRTEALDYTKDMYGYQLGNIKALPDSITKTTAFTFNNKIFPIMEYYTCTDTEKQALRDKVKYNGMTIMVIGKISDYIQSDISYIKGRIIRIEQLNEDFHMLSAISDEIFKGVFI